MRKYYLDNIRWITVILVLIFHVFYMYNSLGLGSSLSIKNGIVGFDSVAAFIYPWFMVLLFLVSGICVRYSLQKRTKKQFVKERVVKLLVPSTLGILVYQWLTGYMLLSFWNQIDKIPNLLVYPFMVYYGIGPTWFLHTLFIVTLVLVIILAIDKNDKIWSLGGKANIPVIIAFFLLIWGGSQILNGPILINYRFGIYGISFLLGYFVFSHDEVLDKVEKIRIPMLIIALVLGGVYSVVYFRYNYMDDKCLKSLLTNAFVYSMVLAVIGCFKAYFNKHNRFTDYMSKISFGLFIVHFPIVFATCFAFYYLTPLPLVLDYLLSFIVVLGLSVCLYELFKRIPVIRFLVLGISKKRNKKEIKHDDEKKEIAEV